MTEEARISFYNIEKCGYYRYNQDNPEFGQISEVMQQLHEWVTQDGCVLSETCTYQIENGDSIYNTYCFDLVHNGVMGDFLLTSWNEVPSVEGQIASVNGSETVGNASVNMSEIEEGHIPGYATYFWFIPTRNVFATICFHNLLNGHRGLQKYMKEYLKKFTNHVVTLDNDGETEILGYTRIVGGHPIHLRPSFVSRLYRIPGRLQYLRSNRQHIYKIIRKNKLNLEIQENLSLWERMLRNLGIADPQPLENEIRVKYEFTHTPTVEELETIIQDWYAEHDTGWDDVGFHIEGEDSPFWLSHSVAKNKYDLDIEKENAEIINAESLMTALTNNRDNILSLIDIRD